MASFNTASFPDSLAIVKEETLTIGTIDEIQVGHFVAFVGGWRLCWNLFIAKEETLTFGTTEKSRWGVSLKFGG